MLQVGGDLDLGEEAVAADDGAELGMQDLDRDLAAVLQVLGEVDGGHAALAELALDAVAVDDGRRQPASALLMHFHAQGAAWAGSVGSQSSSTVAYSSLAEGLTGCAKMNDWPSAEMLNDW